MFRNTSHLHRSMKKLDSQKEKLLMQSRSHQNLLQLHLHCIATYDKNVNNANCRVNWTHFNDAITSKIHRCVVKLLNWEILRMLYSASWNACNVKSRKSRYRNALFHIRRKTHCSYYFQASQHMIKIEINQIMKLSKRFSTLQKWVKSKAYYRRYCTLKFFAHQIQRNEMFLSKLRIDCL